MAFSDLRWFCAAALCSVAMVVVAAPVKPYPPETYDGHLDGVFSNPSDACRDRLAPDIERSGTTVNEGVCQNGESWRSETTWTYSFAGMVPVGNPVNKRFSCMMRTVGYVKYTNTNCDGRNSEWGTDSESERAAVQASVCPKGEVWSPKRFLSRNGGRHYLCLPIKPEYQTQDCKKETKYGNPIIPSVSAKQLKLRFNAFGLVATYDTRSMVKSDLSSSEWLEPEKGGLLMPYHAQPQDSFGLLWQSSHHKKLITSIVNPVLVDGEHLWTSFTATDSPPTKYASPDGQTKLVRTVAWDWILTKENGDVLVFSNDGKLQRLTTLGQTYSYTYSSAGTPLDIAPIEGLLIGITDQYGREMKFSYRNLENSRIGISSIHYNNSPLATLEYIGAGYLQLVKWADDKFLTYLYEDPDKPWAVTGHLDENGVRVSTYGYDNYGRANSTMLAAGVDSYEVEWNDPPEPYVWDEYFDTYVKRTFIQQPLTFRVKTPLGVTAESETVSVGRKTVLRSQTQPGGSGCGASAMSREHDNRGNVLTATDFSGRRTCSAYDSSRNLETTRLEGLIDDPLADPALNTCPADLPSYTIPANLPPEKAQRKIQTQWHPVWHLKTREAEPKRITTWVYNGQPDPLNNNIEASCAPADALLPDGSKIAVLCKRYEQATADETGNLGLAAAALSTRSWSTTYNQHGQVLSETDPRQKKTCHQYWSDTAFDTDGRGHTLGDLWRTSQMAGASQDCTPANMAAQAHKTTHTHYNKRGQVLRTELPNGGVEAREYHLRSWLTKVKQWASVAAADSGASSQDTQYDYYPTGLLKQVTQADGSWQLYLYDDAHRLTDVSDSLGNKVKYTLDNAGNAKQEDHTDPTGVLVKTISRTFDTLGRLQSQKLGAP